MCARGCAARHGEDTLTLCADLPSPATLRAASTEDGYAISRNDGSNDFTKRVQNPDGTWSRQWAWPTHVIGPVEWAYAGPPELKAGEHDLHIRWYSASDWARGRPLTVGQNSTTDRMFRENCDKKQLALGAQCTSKFKLMPVASC